MRRSVLCALIAAACSGPPASGPQVDAGPATQPRTGGVCQGGHHEQCPGGFACKAGRCATTCDPSKGPLLNGCVVGASCVTGACINHTRCAPGSSSDDDCAFDKGEVCQFQSGSCVTATGTCSENTQPRCDSGFACHVSVCYIDCVEARGCPAGTSCIGGSCQ